MTVSYPATVPTSGITNLTWTNATASLISRSPFTFQGQAQAYPGAIRYASISVNDLNREQAEDWVGFLDSLHGTLGTFLFGDPMAVAPMGVGGGGVPLVQTRATTNLDSLTVSVSGSGAVTNWLKRGDWIQLGTALDSRLYKVCNNVNLNSSGVSGTINIWPKFRIVPGIGDIVTIYSPKGLFRRSSGTFNYTETNNCRYNISFDCEEVI